MLNICEVHCKGEIAHLISTPALDNVLVNGSNKEIVGKIEMHGELERLFQGSSNGCYCYTGFGQPLPITRELVKRKKKHGYSLL